MNELSAGLADIVEPAQVVTQGSHASLVMVIAIVLFISVLIVRWWLLSKDRWRILRRLRRLRHDFTTGLVNTRELAYAVAFELRSGLQIHRLCTTSPVRIGDESQRAWCDFVARLDILRYQPGSELDPTQVDALLREAADWARRSR